MKKLAVIFIAVALVFVAGVSEARRDGYRSSSESVSYSTPGGGYYSRSTYKASDNYDSYGCGGGSFGHMVGVYAAPRIGDALGEGVAFLRDNLFGRGPTYYYPPAPSGRTINPWQVSEPQVTQVNNYVTNNYYSDGNDHWKPKYK